MQSSKLISAMVVGALVLTSIEAFVRALSGGFDRPAILVVLGLLATSVLAMSVLATRRGGPPSTPYW